MQLTAPIPNISPLSDEQQRQLNQVLSTLNTQQLAWVSGYLYGLSQSGVQSVATSAAVAAPSGSLTILYGSQTGNAKGVASAIQAQAKAHGLPVTLTSMADYKPKQLKKESHLLVVVSTYGEGEPPESAVDLFEQLKKGKIGKLEGLKFAVLGLGDSSYEFFCQTGKDFDDFLSKAGAERIHELASLDVDYQEAASAWGEQAVNAVASTLSAGAATASVAGSVQQAVGHSQYHKENPFPPRISAIARSTWKSPASLISRGMRWASGSTMTPISWGKCWPGPASPAMKPPPRARCARP